MADGKAAAKPHWQFVTGKLAATALREVIEPLAAAGGFDYSIQVLPITVAALMTPAWIAKRLTVTSGATTIMVPGYCDGDLSPLHALTAVPIVVGPRDLRGIPDFMGVAGQPTRSGYGDHDIEILAEINHAPRLPASELLTLAKSLAADGADVIDLGCQPGERWADVGDVVRRLQDHGLRVSIDSFDPHEIAAATTAGAELVLSVNSTNRAAAPDWGCEVVAVPDDPAEPESLLDTIEFLEQHGVRYCIDPILSPIGFGFADSLLRYAECRRRWPDCEMLMGIGNVTELTDVDSAGVNTILLACCAEWKI
ncbi:MAG: dihydropteroate synthase, partial [Planctomycetales bacterium]|nr:dihydropteroate synthase [Planctomycetales bacterium]